ncbi:MAG: EamA family transporter [Chromatiales bacterium]
MRGALLFSIATLICWGLWGFLGKLGSRSISPGHLLLLTYTGIVIVYPVVLALYARGFGMNWSAPDYYYALASGLVCGLGFPLFYLALSSGEVSRVVVITALYPVVTVLLALSLLHEPMTLKSGIGTVLSIVGILLLST